MSDNSSIVPFSLDDYFQSTPLGSIDKAIGNNLYGINYQQTPGVVPSNKDTYGLTFFVRPQLNMQPDNIRNVRQLSPLLTDSPLSIQNMVKCTLDPRLMYGYDFQGVKVPAIKCPMVDNLNPFIPILTNNLNTISGWPDVIAPTFTSKPGLYNEGFAMVDGITRNYEVYDIEASFRNTKGDPILYMFYIWLHYSSFVFEGKLVPYLDFITENEIDYNTRIYRLVLDKQKEKVTKIAATGAAFPITIPTGSFFDFSNEKPYNDQNRDITIRFKCMGADFQDDILVKEFNDTVAIFNPAMADNQRERLMTLVQKALRPLFNNRGYPRINPKTMDFEVWVPNDLYNNRTTSFLAANLTQSTQLLADEETGD